MSKAAKRAAKRAQRGRPKDMTKSRTPSGQISRAKEPADMVALNARARHSNISVAEARDQKAASFIGILSIRGPHNGGITLAQYDALEEYRRIRTDMLKAIKAPDATISSEYPGGGGEAVSSAYVTWCSSAREKYDRARRAIALEQEGNRIDNLWGALDLCVHQDQRLHHLVGSLRIVANCLAKHFRT